MDIHKLSIKYEDLEIQYSDEWFEQYCKDIIKKEEKTREENKKRLEELSKKTIPKVCAICDRSFIGEGKHCWVCLPYCDNLKDIGGRDLTREKIRIRDNHTCQMCGKIWEQGARKFDVHHKDCEKEKTRQYDNYEVEKNNLITLCHKCHFNLPEHRLNMSINYGKKKKD